MPRLPGDPTMQTRYSPVPYRKNETLTGPYQHILSN